MSTNYSMYVFIMYHFILVPGTIDTWAIYMSNKDLSYLRKGKSFFKVRYLYFYSIMVFKYLLQHCFKTLSPSHSVYSPLDGNGSRWMINV